MLSMMSVEEQEYLYQFAKNQYLGKGAIVDLGCWLGASTVAFAKGLQENSDLTIRNSQIHSFDLFKWDASMDLFTKNTPLENRFAANDSFLDQYLEHIAPWKDQVNYYAGDLRTFDWTDDIEFLFVDAMKSWELVDGIVHKFFPALIPGRSIVFHQDYAYYGTYWIHLLMYRLKDYFEPIYDVPNSWGMAFRYQHEIPNELLMASHDLASFSIDDIDRAFADATQLVAPEKRSQIVGAKVMALMAIGETDQVRSELRTAVVQHVSNAELFLPLGLSFGLQTLDYGLNATTQAARSHQNVEQIQAKLTQAQAEIEQLRATLRGMESSKFWQLRQQWFRVKYALGLSRKTIDKKEF